VTPMALCAGAGDGLGSFGSVVVGGVVVVGSS
jgi:hypothetical protein